MSVEGVTRIEGGALACGALSDIRDEGALDRGAVVCVAGALLVCFGAPPRVGDIRMRSRSRGV